MKEKIPYKLAMLAFQKKELNKFFIGEPPYVFIDKYSPAPGPTDLSDLIYDGLWPYLNDNFNEKNIEYLKSSLKELVHCPEGMYGVASFILQTFFYMKDHKIKLNFDLKEIALELKQSIKYNEDEIKGKKIKLDPRYDLYKTLKILSTNIKNVGGPSFFPEENDQEEGIKI